MTSASTQTHTDSQKLSWSIYPSTQDQTSHCDICVCVCVCLCACVCVCVCVCGVCVWAARGARWWKWSLSCLIEVTVRLMWITCPSAIGGFLCFSGESVWRTKRPNWLRTENLQSSPVVLTKSQRTRKRTRTHTHTRTHTFWIISVMRRMSCLSLPHISLCYI